MISISDPKDCCGCTACASICPHQAISMQPDSLGFLYPVINNSQCTNCGLCEKVCAFNNNYDISQNLSEPVALGARHKDIKEVMNSRSGAVFVALSDYVLEHNGTVYGAGYNEHFQVIHKRATNKQERDELRGSKYVQSDLTDIFPQVKKDLKEGLLVLFSGTPCQTAGLASYIGKKLRSNLLLVDIVCHGVPSPYIWRDYLSFLEEKHYSRVTQVDFRNKKLYGWRAHKDTITFENNEIENEAWYSQFFHNGLFFRESCEKCHFCNLKRPSDLTLGDFWGLEKQDSQFNADDKGVSLLLINTTKGEYLFSQIKEQLNTFKTTSPIYTAANPNLRIPSWVHPQKKQFVNDYLHKGFIYIYKHDYDKVSYLHLQIRKLKKQIKTLLHK